MYCVGLVSCVFVVWAFVLCVCCVCSLFGMCVSVVCFRLRGSVVLCVLMLFVVVVVWCVYCECPYVVVV